MVRTGGLFEYTISDVTTAQGEPGPESLSYQADPLVDCDILSLTLQFSQVNTGFAISNRYRRVRKYWLMRRAPQLAMYWA